MAFIASDLRLIAGVPGRSLYTYDSTDTYLTIDSDGYINNLDDQTNLQKGDKLLCTTWSALDTGTVSMVTLLVVTHVNGDEAATPGNVNLAQAVLAATPLLSTSD